MVQRTDTALIVGCVRDAEPQLAVVLPNLVQISQLFRESAICIYENDSSDGTVEAVRRFPHIQLLTEKNVPGSRTERLARGRNMLLRKARTDYAHFDWLIMMDLDYFTPVDPAGIVAAVESWKTLRWNACTANSRLYYDYWALRHSSFDRDCLAEGPCPYGWVPEAPVTHVRSAFNGIGIYRMSSIVASSCSYDGSTTCEHVSFHSCLGKVIIFKDLQATTWNETVKTRIWRHWWYRHRPAMIGVLCLLGICVLCVVKK